MPTPAEFVPAEFVPSAEDAALIEEVQRRALAYFWEFGHPVSGMARDRATGDADPGNDVVTTGGSGMGAMAILVGVERGWIDRGQAVRRLATMVDFLERADRFHGAVPHFMNGRTGRVIPFTEKDDGGDLVETAFLVQGLLAVRQYFSGAAAAETALRTAIDRFCGGIDWSWYTQGGQDVLYWHWSPAKAGR